MCGIVGAAGHAPVAGFLLQALARLEYRGYDSAGLATVETGRMHLLKQAGKIASLAKAAQRHPLPGHCGIAHTRWATHGEVNETNAHPHHSHNRLALAHNGIIENHAALREELQDAGYVFASRTDSEVIVHLVHSLLEQCGNLREALFTATGRLQGDYALAVIDRDAPGQLVAARRGSPLVVGLGEDEHFVCSDTLGLQGRTNRFLYLEQGDTVELTAQDCQVYDAGGKPVTREIVSIHEEAQNASRGQYAHFMQKEIFEQPEAVLPMLQRCLQDNAVASKSFGPEAEKLLPKTRAVHIVACGTSYHAGLVARHWFEELAGLPCTVEIASEYRYREIALLPDTLFIAISQSGETADTLAALRCAHELPYLGRLAICNVPRSSLVRESQLTLMTEAGTEIGVASTKAFSTQMVALLLLCLLLAQARESQAEHVSALQTLPGLLQHCLALDAGIREWAPGFRDCEHALFLGRGVHAPVMMEGALKLKELSYIHAQAYPAGELKHGPLALVEGDIPVVVSVPENRLREKVISNLEEVAARGGKLYILAEHNAGFERLGDANVLEIPTAPALLSPFTHTVALQLLAYHAAVTRGNNVDQPRNLAKSVTVE